MFASRISLAYMLSHYIVKGGTTELILDRKEERDIVNVKTSPKNMSISCGLLIASHLSGRISTRYYMQCMRTLINMFVHAFYTFSSTCFSELSSCGMCVAPPPSFATAS